MENRRSSSSQPSGVRLLALLQGQGQEILRREENNASLMHLYGTGTHWVAFERSACQLSRLCPEAKIIPMRLSGFPFPVVMATFGQAQSEPFYPWFAGSGGGERPAFIQNAGIAGWGVRCLA